MFGFLPNPWMILGALAAMVSLYLYGHHEGYQESQYEMQAQIAVLNQQARAKEERMTLELNNQSYQLRKANQDADKKNQKLNADLGTGAVRLFVRTTGSVPAGTNTTAASGNRAETRAQLDPEVARSLVAITEDGDKAIRQLNACIDAYNQVSTK